jgi:hypothetical protein
VTLSDSFLLAISIYYVSSMCRKNHRQLEKRKRLKAARGLGGKRLILQSFAGRLDQQVVGLHGLGERRVGFVRSGLRVEGRSPNTKL